MNAQVLQRARRISPATISHSAKSALEHGDLDRFVDELDMTGFDDDLPIIPIPEPGWKIVARTAR